LQGYTTLVPRRTTYYLEKTSLRRYRVGTSADATKMSYNILKSFWELLAPIPTGSPEPKSEPYQDYDIIVATNEAGEQVILHLPKKYSLSYA